MRSAISYIGVRRRVPASITYYFRDEDQFLPPVTCMYFADQPKFVTFPGKRYRLKNVFFRFFVWMCFKMLTKRFIAFLNVFKSLVAFLFVFKKNVNKIIQGVMFVPFFYVF